MSSNGVTFTTNPVSGIMTFGTIVTSEGINYNIDCIARRTDPCIDANLRNRQQIAARLPTIMGLLQENTDSPLTRTTSHSCGGSTGYGSHVTYYGSPPQDPLLSRSTSY